MTVTMHHQIGGWISANKEQADNRFTNYHSRVYL